MNNMKGLGIIIAGVAMSAIGLGIAGISAKKAYDEFKEMDKITQEGHVDFVNNSKVSIEIAGGSVAIHKSETTTSYADYKISDVYTVKYDKEENEFKLARKWKYWFIWTTNKNSTVDIYLAEQDYDAYLEVSAGTLTVTDSFTFNNLDVEISAGTINYNEDINVKNDAKFRVSAGDFNLNGDVIVGNDATLKVSAGDLNVKYIEAKNLNVRISAGDINCKVKSDNIEFRVSAGDLVMNIVGEKLDYTIDIDKSAGSCNIKDNEGGSKKLDGNISAGKAEIFFVSE